MPIDEPVMKHINEEYAFAQKALADAGIGALTNLGATGIAASIGAIGSQLGVASVLENPPASLLSTYDNEVNIRPAGQ